MAEEPTKLELQFRYGRQFSDSIPQLFEMLENTTFDPALHIPSSLSALEEPMAIITFLSRYIIAIVRDFARSPVDYDIILAAYGFLDGYEYTEVHDRRIQYCQYVGKHKNGKDIPLNVYWPKKNIDRSLNAKENAAIKKLAKRLDNEMIKKGGVLGYVAEAEKLIGIPFPSPNYLLGKGYRKCEIENRVFFVPLTEKEFRSLANIPVKKVTSTSPDSETDGNILPKYDITEDERDIISDIDAEDRMSGDFQSEDICPEFSQIDNSDSVKNNESDIVSDKDDIGNSLNKRNKSIPKTNILGVIVILAVLLIILIVISLSPSTSATSYYPLQSEQDLLKLNMENMNREMNGYIVNDVKVTYEYSITDLGTGKEYIYKETISLEQNTSGLEVPVHEDIN